MAKRLSLVGAVFGRLTVLAFAESRCRGAETRPRSFWLCRCDCGSEKVICAADLRDGATQSCGCLKLEHASQLGRVHGGNRPIGDIVGRQFGRLVVLKYSDGIGRRPHWLCKCECGNEKTVSGINLKSGHTRSCGCLHRENSIKQATIRRGMVPSNRTHGLTKTPLYKAWSGMLQRCENANNPRWPNYGGRGIKVCDRWRFFENFNTDVLATIGPKPEGMSLDRIDNDGNYEPSNIRWATQKQQVENQRKRKRIDLFSNAELLAELKRRENQI